MPELPEVETVASDLRCQSLEGAVIAKAEVYWQRSIAYPSIKEFCKELEGKKILKISRKGKYLLFTLERTLTLAVHLRMSGKFFLSPSRPKGPHEHVAFFFTDGRILFFHDTRKFGKIHLLSNPDDLLAKLGPEPIDPAFTFEDFERRIKDKKSGRIKALLLDQSFLAGLGNIYADEALWQAEIHPERPANSLTEKERRALFKAVRSVLLQGIENGGTSLGHGKGNFHGLQKSGANQSNLKVYKREDELCYRCRQAIIRLTVASRGTHICPNCQKL